MPWLDADIHGGMKELARFHDRRKMRMQGNLAGLLASSLQETVHGTHFKIGAGHLLYTYCTHLWMTGATLYPRRTVSNSAIGSMYIKLDNVTRAKTAGALRKSCWICRSKSYKSILSLVWGEIALPRGHRFPGSVTVPTARGRV